MTQSQAYILENFRAGNTENNNIQKKNSILHIVWDTSQNSKLKSIISSVAEKTGTAYKVKLFVGICSDLSN